MSIRRVAIIAWGPHELPRLAARGVEAYSDQHARWILDIFTVGKSSVQQLAAHDAVIGFMPGDEDLQSGLLERGVPAVNISGRDTDPILPRVLTDNRAVGRLAAEHLIAKGIRRLVYLHIGNIAYGQTRGDGFREAAERAGGDVTAPADSREASILSRLDERDLPVGVFAPNDGRARRFVMAALEAGRRVPEDLAVVGADNTQLLCDFGPVPLTSVDTAGFQVGWRAAEVIHRWLETGDAPTGDTLVPPAGVVERQSTDVVPGSDPLIADAIRYIRAYARHGVTVREVAARFAMSRRTLERHVRDVLGRSPHEEIRRVRFQLAKRLLLDEELILAEVSRRSGFGNAKHFAREFKAAFGLTPGEYRRRSGGK